MIAGLVLALAAQAVPAQEITGGPYTIVPRAGQEALASRLLENALSMPPLPGLPASATSGVRIELAEDEADFAALTGGRAPDWGAGIAYPELGRIVLPAYASTRGNLGSLPNILRHEIAHVALHQYVDPAAVPRWFSEGYATWAAGQLDLEAGWILRLAFVTGSAPSLDSITLGWPRNTTDARVAYLLTASTIQWLHARGGDRVLGLFLDRWKETGRFEGALRETYGLTTGQLERYWGRSVRRRYGWLLFFAQASVAWAMLSIIVVMMFAVRWRRDRRRLADLRRHELPDRPAYWLGETALTPVESAARPDSGTGQLGTAERTFDPGASVAPEQDTAPEHDTAPDGGAGRGGSGPAPPAAAADEAVRKAETDTRDDADSRFWTLDGRSDVPRSSGHHGT